MYKNPMYESLRPCKGYGLSLISASVGRRDADLGCTGYGHLSRGGTAPGTGVWAPAGIVASAASGSAAAAADGASAGDIFLATGSFGFAAAAANNLDSTAAAAASLQG